VHGNKNANLLLIGSDPKIIFA